MAKGSVNKVIVLGRLGQDPEITATASGMQIGTLSIATTELGRKDQATGQRGPDETEWHRVKVFAKTAELAAQYLKKGSKVYIEGRLKTNKWQDQSGNDRYTTEIICNEMQFMGERGDSGGGQGGQQKPAQQNYQQPAPQRAPQQQQQPAAPQPAAPQPAQKTGFDDFDDDIPF